MKGTAGGGTELRVSFSEMREGAGKRGEAEWADGARVSAYMFSTGSLAEKQGLCPESVQM